ncbi:MAG: glycosyltransferase family 4 protein [Anaerolineae bacterium]|nr:glycosyltransferase family 4 protein [Anaerolineae bacterium]MDW8099856.1 glycosyltransferase family 4 protein [Anaerolineae bacterium]
MKVLFVLHRFFPDSIGGTEQHVWDLAHGLRERGHEVAVFYRATGPAGLQLSEWDGIPTYRAQAGPLQPLPVFLSTLYDPRLTALFRQVVSSFRPDVIYLAHLMGLPIALTAELRRLHIPWVLSLHDYWWVCANAQLITNDTEELCDGPRYWVNCARCGLARLGWRRLAPLAPALAPAMALRGRRLRSGLERADRILAFSEFVRTWYLRHGTPAERLVRVRMGIRGPEVIPRRTRLEGPVRFLYAGGLAPQKGLHVLIEAFQRADAPAELWIAGDVQAFPAYVERLRMSARHPGIRFLGRVARDDLWPLMAEADVVAVPSLWHETFSYLAHEAFLVGVPVVASAVGALPEVVQHEVNGILVPPGDVDAWTVALRQLASDPVLRAHLRSHLPPVRTFAEYLDEMEALLATVVSSRQPSGHERL